MAEELEIMETDEKEGMMKAALKRNPNRNSKKLWEKIDLRKEAIDKYKARNKDQISSIAGTDITLKKGVEDELLSNVKKEELIV